MNENNEKQSSVLYDDTHTGVLINNDRMRQAMDRASSKETEDTGNSNFWLSTTHYKIPTTNAGNIWQIVRWTKFGSCI